MSSLSIFSNPVCGVDINCGYTFLPRLLFLFDPVWWSYPFKNFDNTWATYLTDYALCIFMLYGVYTVIRDSGPSPLRARVILLLSLYAISVLSGGLAHQFFLTPDGVPSLLDIKTATALNQTSFRLLWSICVASVCVAGGAFGAIACQLGGTFENISSKTPTHSKGTNISIVRKVTSSMGFLVGGFMGALIGGIIGGFYGLIPNTAIFQYSNELNPSGRSGSMISTIMSSVIGIGIGFLVGSSFGFLLPHRMVSFATCGKLELFWFFWAFIFIVLTALGALSMLQPAADIFVAGFSQAFSTMHITAVFICNYHCDLAPFGNKTHLVAPIYRNIFLIGLFLNMPLIVIYPLVLSYFPSLSLGFVNCCLHCCLATAWGMQWYSLKGYCSAYFPKDSIKNKNKYL